MDERKLADAHQERRARLNQRLRQAFIEGAQEDSRRRLGRGLTPEELERVLRRYPGDMPERVGGRPPRLISRHRGTPNGTGVPGPAVVEVIEGDLPPRTAHLNRLTGGSTRSTGGDQMNAKRGAASLLLGVLLAACASAPGTPMPAGSSPPTPSPMATSTTAATASPATTSAAAPSPTPVAPSASPASTPMATAIPSPFPSPLPTPAPTPASCVSPEVHVVVSGDTLWEIAQDHGLPLDALLAANPHITDPRLIRPGDAITVPSWRIAFVSRERDDQADDIYTVNVDGSCLARLTNDPTGDRAPDWSPDGTRIAFACGIEGGATGGDICVMRADGTGLVRLTHDTPMDWPNNEPTWSPDGSRIAFRHSGQLYTMRPDGTDLTLLTRREGSSEPAWSPDGTQIAFSSVGGLDPNGFAVRDVYVVNADGTAVRNLTRDLASDDSHPAWSPDGKRIAYTSNAGGAVTIWMMDADGGNRTRISQEKVQSYDPAWSPDGTKIVFTRHGPGFNFTDIYVMNADGTATTAVTNLPNFQQAPDWLPVPWCPTPWCPAQMGSSAATTTLPPPTPTQQPASLQDEQSGYVPPRQPPPKPVEPKT